MNTLVRTLLQHKGHSVVTIDRNATVYEAIALMVARKVGSLVITGDGHICGIFTERDYMRRIVLCGRTSQTTKVGDVATTELHVIGPNETIETCMAKMSRYRCRHLPVIDSQGRLIGLVSIGDCVAHLCSELRAENGVLFEYIAGWYPG